MSSIQELIESGLSADEAADYLSGAPSPDWVRAQGGEAVERWRACRELCIDVAERQSPYDPAIRSRFVWHATRSAFASADLSRDRLEGLLAVKRRRDARRQKKLTRRARPRQLGAGLRVAVDWCARACRRGQAVDS